MQLLPLISARVKNTALLCMLMLMIGYSSYARHTWASIAFNIGIQKDVVSLALGHSFGVRVTDTYINADLSRVDEANRRVIDYVLYNKK